MVLVASILMALLGFGLIAMSLGSLIDLRDKARKDIKEKYATTDTSMTVEKQLP